MKEIPIRKLPPSDKKKNFRIRELKEMFTDGDLKEPLHRHDFYYLLIVESASGVHTIDFDNYTITDQSIFFLRPGQMHKLTLKAKSTGYLLHFKKDFLENSYSKTTALLQTVSFNNQYIVDTIVFKKIKRLLEVILQESKEGIKDYNEAIKANLILLLIQLSREKEVKETTQISYEQEKLEQFKIVLQNTIKQQKKATVYANELGMSVYQLNAITKKTLGKTSSELINEYIVLEAKRYLLATNYQINQIAYYLGYQDSSYFIRFFKKHTGNSPAIFRQKNKK